MSNFTRDQAMGLRKNILKASVQCSERCLYQSAKWSDAFSLYFSSSLLSGSLSRLAELASSLPNPSDFGSSDDTDSDSPMKDVDQSVSENLSIFSSSDDAEEKRLEAQEIGNYLLAKSYFDCREYDRCSAVLLPSDSAVNVPSSPTPETPTQTPTKASKGKGKATAHTPEEKSTPRRGHLPQMSQKSLFLALYAKYMAGEKRKDEDAEMILGPMDSGAIENKELVGIGRTLEAWFEERIAQGKANRNHGWLEYLYGIVLVKGHSDNDAKQYFLKSLKLNPWNWSAWLELRDLLNDIDA
ncbi:MAG: hypothetical protein Q9211_004779, partial [Gyalolechia sp. 1 TL-2023]